jgi:general secretion pathway protein L
VATAFANQLEHWRLRVQTSGAAQFLRWWKGELLQLLPSGLRARLAHAQGRVLVRVHPTPDPGELALSWHEGDLDQTLDVFALDQDLPVQRQRIADLLHERDYHEAPRDLLLEDSQVLSKRVFMPLAAEGNLRQALGYEMDRHTPFAASDVYFDYRVLERDRERAQLEVELKVTPKTVVDERVELLAPRGLAPTGVDVLTEQGPVGLNLLPPDQRFRMSRRRTRINALLAAVTLLLLAGLMAQSLWLRQRQIDQVNEAIEAVRAEARSVQQIREQIEDASEAAGFMMNRRVSVPPTVEVLAEATRLLPDDTYLDRFRVWEGNVQMQGKSANAQQLIELINESRLFEDTEFRGSTRTDRRSGREIFDLRAALEPGVLALTAGAQTGADQEKSGRAETGRGGQAQGGKESES